MYDDKQCLGKNADYALLPAKQKCIDLYVESQPLETVDLALYTNLLLQIPVGMQYGIRIRTWKTWYPDVPFLGHLIGYSVYDEQGGAVEILAPANTFNMKQVPWEEVIA